MSRPLSSQEDRELIRRCLEACQDRRVFEDFEFETLFGLIRPAFCAAARRWTEQGRVDPEIELAIHNALNSLLGYPHGMDDRLRVEFGVSREQLGEVFRRWRTA